MLFTRPFGGQAFSGTLPAPASCRPTGMLDRRGFATMRKGLKSALGILTVLVLAAACASLRGTQGGFLDTRYSAEELDLPDAEKEDLVVCNVDPRNPGAAYLVTDRREVYALIPEETTWRYTPIARLASARPRIICGDAWPGNGSLPELYISDGRRLVMLAWTSAGWLDPQLLYESAARIPEKAAVGDVDPRVRGRGRCGPHGDRGGALRQPGGSDRSDPVRRRLGAAAHRRGGDGTAAERDRRGGGRPHQSRHASRPKMARH